MGTMSTLWKKATSVAAVAALPVGAIAAEVVSYLSLKRYGEGLDGIPTVVMEEFPDIDRDLLDKFSSFDRKLGWVPQPNTTKQKDTGDHLPGEDMENIVEYSTDEYGSRVCPAEDRDDDADFRVSTYGDSYCFCRGVNDDETFQHYLAEELGTHVGNYGGGNYGMDQALMRLKDNYDDDPADYVCMVTTSSSMPRILSAWKHYQEFGNILAVKPRYEFGDGSLERIETPLEEKEDLLDLEDHADYLRRHDGHYEPWFKPHLASFPYTTDFFGTPDNVRYALYGAMKDLESRYEVSIPGIDFHDRQTRAEDRLEQEQVAYHDRLWDERSDDFATLVGEFVSVAEEKEFTPVFVMLQQLRYAEYEQGREHVYGDMVERLDEEYDDLLTVDVAEQLGDVEDIGELYTRAGEGGHHTPETNERIAEILAEEVFGRAEAAAEQ
jgi:hypothetical protein